MVRSWNWSIVADVHAPQSGPGRACSMRVSVALCTYNGERFLAEQLTSILDQTRLPDEIVVRDDRSSDHTVAILRRIAANSPVPIHVQVNAENLGSTRNFEAAIADCSGDLIFLADQDDFWLPHKIAAMTERFERELDLGALFSDADVVDESLQPLGLTMFQFTNFDARKQSRVNQDDAQDLLLLEAFVTGSALAFRTDLRSRILPIPQGRSDFIHDRWIGLVAAATSRLSTISESLILYRQHDRQQVGTPIAVSDAEDAYNRRWNRGAVFYEGQLSHLRWIRTHVQRNLGSTVKPELLAALNIRIGHLEMRSALPQNRWRRIPLVIKDLVLGRYHRFSNGAQSAVKDLLFA